MKKKLDILKYSLLNENKSGYKTKKTWFITNESEHYACLIGFIEKNGLLNLSWKEQLFLYINQITEIPTCKNCGI